jgi:hypothetical protein
VRELGLGKGVGELATAAAAHNYVIRVFTGDVRYAGTDANVYIVLFGSKSDSGKLPLADSATNRNKFERAQMDEFQAACLGLGPLQKIVIGHDGSGVGAGWHLDKVRRLLLFISCF